MRFVSLTLAAAMLAAPAVAEDVEYTVDGETFTGYFAAAEAPKGLVLIVHDWDGMTDYERQRADMLLALLAELLLDGAGGRGELQQEADGSGGGLDGQALHEATTSSCRCQSRRALLLAVPLRHRQ